MIKPFYFCPNCRRKIDTPKMFLSASMKIRGKIKLNCGHCNPDGKGNSKGVVVIKPEIKELTE